MEIVSDLLHAAILASGYALTMLLSGIVVRLIAGSPRQDSRQNERSDAVPLPEAGETQAVRVSGAVIGKCENFLALTFVLSGELTALALVFTAKSIVRLDAMKRDPQYYLGGTLVNLCFSILMGYVLKYVLNVVG